MGGVEVGREEAEIAYLLEQRRDLGGCDLRLLDVVVAAVGCDVAVGVDGVQLIYA